jgi:uncharacterized protein YggT (Ycf19 family)
MQPAPTNQSYEPQQPVASMTPMSPHSPPARVETTGVSNADRIAQVVYVLFGVLEGLIVLRILLKLLGANPDAGFSAFVYNITAPFVGFFQGVFSTPTAHTSVFEFSSVLALVVYALVGWGIVRLIEVFGQRQTTTLR